MLGQYPRLHSGKFMQRHLSLGTGPGGSRFAGETGTVTMKLYRIDKLARHGGVVIKKKHILAPTDRNAVEQAEDSEDCPICDVLRDGRLVGQVV